MAALRNRLLAGVSLAVLLAAMSLVADPKQPGGTIQALPGSGASVEGANEAPNQGWRPSPTDGMEQIHVPAGAFLMGSTDEGEVGVDEQPQHRVWLDGYWIDKTEITNSMFEGFVEATNHRTVAEERGFAYGFVEGQFVAIPGAYWGRPLGPGSSLVGRGHHPVVAMGWSDARAYCRWAGRRLPSEAEWERAARGRFGRRYPWGDAPPTGDLVNFADANAGLPWGDMGADDGYARTSPVGSFPGGASAVGALDMAGNAWEWVNDWYDPNWYRRPNQPNPRGPRTGTFKVIRGGSYADDAFRVRSARRTFDDVTHTTIESGFRCAQSERTIRQYLPLVEKPPTPTPTVTVAPTATADAAATATRPPVPPGNSCDPIPGSEYVGIRTNGGWDGRPAERHPDINLSIRGWERTAAHLGLIDMGGSSDAGAPRLYGLLPRRYGPGRASFTSAYRVYDWIWSRGQRGSPLSTYEVTLVGMASTPGEELTVPWSAYDIGTLDILAPSLVAPGGSGHRWSRRPTVGYSALVLYASENRITLTYTRDDTAAKGYMLHVEGVCVEPSLRELYQRLDRGGRRDLPALRAGDPFGRARGSEILVAIRDSGTFMEPRSRKDWWR